MKRRNFLKAVVGKKIVEVYLDGNYTVFKLSDGSIFSVHSDFIFDNAGNYFNSDDVDYRV